jgi:hypothetical protein
MTTSERTTTLRSHFGADRHSTLSLGTLYFALFNGDPLAAGVEPTSVGGYARVAKANSAATFGTIAAGATSASNSGASGEIAWPALTALWSQSQVTHWAIFDNSTGGTMWYSGQLSSPIVPTGVGDIPRIPAGSFQINATG